MSNQARLDLLENMILSAGSTAKMTNLLKFGGRSQELQQIEDILGDMLAEVLDFKKDLGCTSILSMVNSEAQS